MDKIISTLSRHHLAVMTGILVLLLALSGKKRGGKLLRFLMILLAASIVYELAWQEPVTAIPERINNALNHPQPKQSSNPHYYQIPGEEKQLLDEQ